MAICVQTSLDTSAFTARLEYATKEGLQAIRAGVNAAAVLAKRDFIKAVVPDAAGKGINEAAVRKQTTPIKRASAANLSASFIVSNKGFERSPFILNLMRGNQHKPGGATIRTFALTGGGSQTLANAKFFVIASNGGQVVVQRTGRGKGRNFRGLFKRIYAEGPKTSMAQAGAAPRKVWDRTAATEAKAQVAARLSRVFDGQSAGAELSE